MAAASGKRAATTADEYETAQAAEWSTYVATVPIDFYGVRAYNTGDPVPASAVGDDEASGRWVPEDFVRKISDEAPAFAGSTTVVDPAPPTIDPNLTPAPAATPAAAPTTEG